MKKNLVIINNEKCTVKEEDPYCENVEIKSFSDNLIKNYNLKFLLRSGDVSPVYKMDKLNTEISRGIFSFTNKLIKSIFYDKAK